MEGHAPSDWRQQRRLLAHQLRLILIPGGADSNSPRTRALYTTRFAHRIHRRATTAVFARSPHAYPRVSSTAARTSVSNGAEASTKPATCCRATSLPHRSLFSKRAPTPPFARFFESPVLTVAQCVQSVATRRVGAVFRREGGAELSHPADGVSWALIASLESAPTSLPPCGRSPWPRRA